MLHTALNLCDQISSTLWNKSNNTHFQAAIIRLASFQTLEEVETLMSRFTLKGRRGFTLIEIMIVVLIIAVLLAIAIPNFMKARDTSRTKACIANLRQIDTGKVQYAMDQKLTTGGAVDWGNLVPDYVKDQPECPAGGDYTIGVIDTNPSCTIAGHTLDAPAP